MHHDVLPPLFKLAGDLKGYHLLHFDSHPDMGNPGCIPPSVARGLLNGKYDPDRVHEACSIETWILPLILAGIRFFLVDSIEEKILQRNIPSTTIYIVTMTGEKQYTWNFKLVGRLVTPPQLEAYRGQKICNYGPRPRKKALFDEPDP
eukprot:gene21774-8435_t